MLDLGFWITPLEGFRPQCTGFCLENPHPSPPPPPNPRPIHNPPTPPAPNPPNPQTLPTLPNPPTRPQPAIVESLQRYSAQIDDLKRDMDEATAIAGGAEGWRGLGAYLHRGPGGWPCAAPFWGRARAAGAGRGKPNTNTNTNTNTNSNSNSNSNTNTSTQRHQHVKQRRAQPPKPPKTPAPNPDAVRGDLKLLAGRAATVSGREPCARCGRALLDAPPNAAGLPAGGAVPQFYVYPTGWLGA